MPTNHIVSVSFLSTKLRFFFRNDEATCRKWGCEALPPKEFPTLTAAPILFESWVAKRPVYVSSLLITLSQRF